MSLTAKSLRVVAVLSLLIPSSVFAAGLKGAAGRSARVTFERGGTWAKQVWKMDVASQPSVQAFLKRELGALMNPGAKVAVKLSAPHGQNVSFHPNGDIDSVVRVIARITASNGEKYEACIKASKGAVSWLSPIEVIAHPLEPQEWPAARPSKASSPSLRVVEPEAAAPRVARSGPSDSLFNELKASLARQGITLQRGSRTLADPANRTITIGRECDNYNARELRAAVAHEATHVQLGPLQQLQVMAGGPAGYFAAEWQADLAAMMQDPVGFSRALNKLPNKGIDSMHGNPIRWMNAMMGGGM